MVDLSAMAKANPGLPDTVLGWIERGLPGRERLRRLLADGAAERYRIEVIDGAELVAPIPRLPRNVICVGANYVEHIDESERVVGALALPDAPVYFTKDVRSICGPDDDIVVDPAVTTQLDWEVELAVVIGTEGRDISPERALDHVWGYAILNDISARDVQLSRNQWWKGKSVESSSPFGPYIVTSDEVGDPQDLDLWCWVDGVEKQHGSTKQMIHSVAAIIADLSSTLTLLPGDVISTGTPSGVGLARNPQEWLTAGRLVETEISLLGRQANRVISKKEQAHG
ncbi:fumarylacetoacetate hydrolase family protein [Prauserella flavalba]|uniref:fumarylacetoacetate hydrolase family protein n=1 Tax=Prauserella flavalba TaxID=1477506 RepID=UPI0036E9C27C